MREQPTLTWLNLEDNTISDISPVTGLTNLTYLSLGENNISDISPVTGLTNLTRLYLSWNTISDISPVTGLTNLTRLYLSWNNISDISPLVANTGLGSGDTVDLRDNYLLSINPTSIKTHIPTLQSRGVTVEFDDRTHLNRGEPYTVRFIYFPPKRQTTPARHRRKDGYVDKDGPAGLRGRYGILRGSVEKPFGLKPMQPGRLWCIALAGTAYC